MSSTDPYGDDDDRTYTEEAYEEDEYRSADYPEDDYGTDTYDESYDDSYAEDDDEGILGESLALLLFVVGLVLFLFPEPGTSTLGLVLMVAALFVWAADAIL